MVFSLLEVVEEGPRSAGGPPLQANVVVLTVEELPPFWVDTVVLGTGVGLWGRFVSVAVMAAGAAVDFGTRALGALVVLGMVVVWVAGAGLVVPPGAGALLGASRVLVPRVLTAGLVTRVPGGALPVAAGVGAELGEVALGLVAARMVVRRVAAGVVVVFFGVADWWMRHGAMELGAGAGRAVGVAAGPRAVLGWGVEARGAVLVGRVGLTAFGVGGLGLVFGVLGGRLLVAMGLGEARRAVVGGAVVVGAILAEVVG